MIQLKYHLGSLLLPSFPSQAGRGLSTGSRTPVLSWVYSSCPHPTLSADPALIPSLIPSGVQPALLLPARGSRVGSALCRRFPDCSAVSRRLRPSPAHEGLHRQGSEGPDDQRRPETQEGHQRGLGLGATDPVLPSLLRVTSGKSASVSKPQFPLLQKYISQLFPEHLLCASY